MAENTIAVQRILPLSAFRVALSLALVGLIAWLIAAALLYLGMDIAGIWDSVNSLIGDVGGERGVSFGMFMAGAVLFGGIFTVLIACLAPLTAVIYNAVVDLFGGLEVEIAGE